MNESDAAPAQQKPELEIPIGTVRFGDLRRLSPIGRDFGYDRGTPVDRYYIEGFLARNASDIRGRVLEVASNTYTKRFGGNRVAQSDVLSVDPADRNATIIGDIVWPHTLSDSIFDCIIFTQTLHYVYDVRIAIEMLYRALRPGGILLATTPGIVPMGDCPGHPEKPDRWPWYWIFTPASLRRLLEDRFGSHEVMIESHGNIFASTAFLYGLAAEELQVSDLNVDDPRYPVTIAGRANKRTPECNR